MKNYIKAFICTLFFYSLGLYCLEQYYSLSVSIWLHILFFVVSMFLILFPAIFYWDRKFRNKFDVDNCPQEKLRLALWIAINFQDEMTNEEKINLNYDEAKEKVLNRLYEKFKHIC